jgi:hypothetical protein
LASTWVAPRAPRRADPWVASSAGQMEIVMADPSVSMTAAEKVDLSERASDFQ